MKKYKYDVFMHLTVEAPSPMNAQEFVEHAIEESEYISGSASVDDVVCHEPEGQHLDYVEGRK